jgi:VWFA-related protein
MSMNPKSTFARTVRTLATACAISPFSSLALAQQNTPSPPQAVPFKIQVKVDAVLVTVVVRDAKGRAVGTLKKEDFQIFDKDKPRSISGFTVQTRSSGTRDTRTPAVGTSSSGISPTPSLPSEAVVPERTLVFLFDDLHINPSDLALVQKAATSLLQKSLADTDRAAVISFAGINSGITHDRAKLQEAIMKLQSRNLYRHLGRECPDIDYYRADQIQNKHDITALEAAVQDTLTCAHLDPKFQHNMAESMARSAASRTVELGDQDVRVTLGFIKDLIRNMSALPGQRTLILVSPGFLTITSEALSAKSQIIDFAAQNNVTISAMDARGLYTTATDATERGEQSTYALITGYESQTHRDSMSLDEDVMAEFADGTGGTFFHNSNDLSGGLEALADGPEYLYLLEMPLDEVKPDGTYHRLKVKVDQKGLKLQARHGYFAPAPPPKDKK